MDSVSSQSIDVEPILVDGCSTDATVDIADSDNVAMLVLEPYKGIYDSMNRSVQMVTGEVSNASLYSRIAAKQMDRKAWEVNGLNPYP